MTSILLFIVCNSIYINKLKFCIDLVIFLFYFYRVLSVALSNVFALRLCWIDGNWHAPIGMTIQLLTSRDRYRWDDRHQWINFSFDKRQNYHNDNYVCMYVHSLESEREQLHLWYFLFRVMSLWVRWWCWWCVNNINLNNPKYIR